MEQESLLNLCNRDHLTAILKTSRITEENRTVKTVRAFLLKSKFCREKVSFTVLWKSKFYRGKVSFTVEK